MTAQEHAADTDAPEDPTLELATGWRFGGRLRDAYALTRDYDDSGDDEVTLPHCVAPLSWRDWEPSTWEGVWLYRNRFRLPESFAGRRVLLEFAGVLSGATPYVNGHALPHRAGGYLPFGYEVTDLLAEGKDVLAVAVDARWAPVPPSGHPDGAAGVDYFQPGGIYRAVTLRAVPQVHIADLHARPLDVLDPQRRRVEVTCTVDADLPVPESAVLAVEVRDGERAVARAEVPTGSMDAGVHRVSAVVRDLPDIRLWDVTDPNLYQVTATLLVGGAPEHTARTRIGFREARFALDGFFLNGRRLHLFGLNRHQLFPYTGMAMPDRVQRRDAQILREELNCTMVRCAHYPQSAAFLDACDELGLLVFEEVPGWQYLGDEQWQDLVVRDVADMVRRDRNRPSVVLWGVQVNESAVATELYTRTRDRARELDPDRATTGAMLAANYTTAGFPQDVFSYNDYAHEDGRAILKPPLPGLPYLVTEAVGSLVGARFYRRTDGQDVQARQARLHAQVHDIATGDPRHSGLLAWQAFDYQSMTGFVDHRLKCNGVADAFRIPKPGAALYRSQVDPGVRPVIEPAFLWDFGSDPAGSGATPAGTGASSSGPEAGTSGPETDSATGPEAPTDGPGPEAMICANCDRLEVFVDDLHHSTLLPDHKGHSHLPHPPFFADLSLDDSHRGTAPTLRLEGYHRGRRIAVREFSSDPADDRLSLLADDVRLAADGVDTTRVVLRAVDRYGAQRPGVEGQVRITVTGPGTLIGDDPFPLDTTGGAGAVWLRTHAGAPGTVKLTASHPTLGSATTEITTTRRTGGPI